MTPARQPHPQRCVLTMHEVQSIKDLIFVVGGNSESSAQKAIFEILADGVRKATTAHSSTQAPGPEQCPAQAVLDSAIKDLDREIKDQQWMIDNYTGHHKEIHENISKALRYALNLLRGLP